MGESGCLKDGHFQNLQVEGNTQLKDTSISGFVNGSATKTLLAEESGKIIAVGAANGGLGAHATFTLPSLSNGLYYKFAYFGGSSTAFNLTIKGASASVILIGGLAHFDTNDDDTNGIPDQVYTTSSNSNDILTVTVPGAGTVIDVICDGTNWLVSGNVCAALPPTFSSTD